MATYKITSDNTSLGERGKTVSDEDIFGLNVDSLIEGGHIAEVTNKPSVTKVEDK